jgi:hypothetical protein
MAFRSSTNALGAGGVNTVVINTPAGVALNDIIFVAVEDNGNTVTWPSGFSATFAQWTCTGSSHGRAGSWSCAWKLATGSEPSTYTVNVATGGSGNIKAVAGAWSGRASTPGAAVVSSAAGNAVTPVTVTLTGYTAATGDDVLVFIGLADTDSAGSWATSNSIAYTTRQDLNDNGTFRGGVLNISTIDNISAGATGTLHFTETGSGLVATSGGDTAGVVIPLPIPVVITPTSGPMARQIYVMP